MGVDYALSSSRSLHEFISGKIGRAVRIFNTNISDLRGREEVPRPLEACQLDEGIPKPQNSPLRRPRAGRRRGCMWPPVAQGGPSTI